MITPYSAKIAKRATPTADQATVTQTSGYLSADSVASAISKLNNTITKLKQQNQASSSAIAGCAVVIVLLCLLLLMTVIIVSLRVANRKRASAGQDYLAGTGWAMFPLGPTLNSNFNEKSTQQAHELGRSNADMSLNQVVPNMPHKLPPSSSPSTSSIGTYVNESSPVQRQMNGAFEHIRDDSSSKSSAHSSPNVNRYTIDIEFDPYSQQLSPSTMMFNTTTGSHSIPLNDTHNGQSNTFNNVTNTHMTQQQNNHMNTRIDSGQYQYPPQDIFPPIRGNPNQHMRALSSSSSRSADEISNISPIRNLSQRKKPSVEQEEDAFGSIDPASLHPVRPNFVSANRVSVVSSVYDRNGANLMTPDIDIAVPKI